MRSSAQAFVVASDDGFVLAQCGQGLDPAWAAALAPAIFHKGWTYPRPLEADFRVEAVKLAHGTVYFIVLGSKQPVTRVSGGTVDGVRRILEERTLR